MRYSFLTGVTASAVVALVLSGCATKRQPQANIPVSSTGGLSVIPGAAAGSSAETPAAIPAEESLDYERVTVPPLDPADVLVIPEPAKNDAPKPAVRNSPARNPRTTPVPAGRTAEPESAVETEVTRVPDARAPALRPMISDTDRRQLDGQIHGNLERFRKNVGMIRESRLGQNERNALEEAKSIAIRAEQLRGGDPLLANSLAERAAILTQEILRKQ